MIVLNYWASLVAQMVKCLPAMREEMVIHSSTLAWKIPWTEQPNDYCPGHYYQTCKSLGFPPLFEIAALLSFDISSFLLPFPKSST